MKMAIDGSIENLSISASSATFYGVDVEVATELAAGAASCPPPPPPENCGTNRYHCQPGDPFVVLGG